MQKMTNLAPNGATIEKTNEINTNLNIDNSIDRYKIDRLYNVDSPINKKEEKKKAEKMFIEQEFNDELKTVDNFSSNEKEIVDFLKTRNEENGLTNNAPVQEGTIKWSKRINRNNIKKFFRDLANTDVLNFDETMRVTGNVIRANGDLSGVTISNPIQCAEDLIEHIINQYKVCDQILANDGISHHDRIGASMSSAIFKFNPDTDLKENCFLLKKAPSLETFKRTKTFVLDIDSHIAEIRTPESLITPEVDTNQLPTTYVPGKERFSFNSLDLPSKLLAFTQIITIINQQFDILDLGIRIFPTRVYNTGGGLQLHFDFDKWLTTDNVSRIFDIFKSILSYLKNNQIKLFGRLDASLDDKLIPYFLEFDASSADIAHTQRVSGLVNDKEVYNGAFAYELAVDGKPFADLSADFIETFIDSFIKDISGSIKYLYQNDMFFNIDYKHITDFNVKKTQAAIFKELKISINSIKKIYRELYEELFSNINNNIEEKRIIKVSEIIDNFNMVSALKESERNENVGLLEPNKAVEFNILKLMTYDQQLDYIKYFLDPNTPEQLRETSSNYIKYRCPIHQEDTPSFAVYLNKPKLGDTKNSVIICKDFHEGGQIYNCITLARAIKQKINDEHYNSIGEESIKVTRSDIIKEIVARYRIELPKEKSKAIFESENDDIVDNLISQVDNESQIFYRKNNKSRDCIIRDKESGTFVTFDGTQMLTDHVLTHQLGMNTADKPLRSKFHNAFCDKILEGLFEEFKPGADYIFTDDRNMIKYVNTWVPNQNFLAVKENSKKYNEMTISEALILIKEKLPVSFFYLCQLTQKGSIGYFINWLANTANFKVMSSIPVLTSVQGTGKGVFIDEWMKYYLSNDYVKVVQSDRALGQFNSFMETSQLIVLDEGDFSTTKEVDSLKFMTGNSEIPIEKKGVDTVTKQRFFNFILMTNGDTPLKHPYNDRRTTYQRLEIPLFTASLSIGISKYEQFVEELRKERLEFWSIIKNIKRVDKWTSSNMKNNQFNRQIFQMHPFGKLALQIIDNKWNDISGQIIEGKTNPEDITNLLKLVADSEATLKNVPSEADKKSPGYDENEYQWIDFSLVNKYIESSAFKSYTSISDFINNNGLSKFGIKKFTKIIGNKTYIRIRIDVNKARLLVDMNNNLEYIDYEKYCPENIKETIENINIDSMTADEDDVMGPRTGGGHLVENVEHHQLSKEDQETEGLIPKELLMLKPEDLNKIKPEDIPAPSLEIN